MSSAKSLTLDLTCSGRSFMYARNKMGPRTDPCGTPEETGNVQETGIVIRKYHNHKQQTNPRHREEELHDIYSNKTSKRL